MCLASRPYVSDAAIKTIANPARHPELADIEDTSYSAQVVRGTKRALILGVT